MTAFLIHCTILGRIECGCMSRRVLSHGTSSRSVYCLKPHAPCWCNHTTFASTLTAAFALRCIALLGLADSPLGLLLLLPAVGPLLQLLKFWASSSRLAVGCFNFVSELLAGRRAAGSRPPVCRVQHRSSVRWVWCRYPQSLRWF